MAQLDGGAHTSLHTKPCCCAALFYSSSRHSFLHPKLSRYKLSTQYGRVVRNVLVTHKYIRGT
jgi:hypothetical protein